MTTCEETAASKCVVIIKKAYAYQLIEDVHKTLPLPTSKGETFLMRGNFTYFHYGCDDSNDIGWGCGYRTLQSAISWLINKTNPADKKTIHVPSIKEIQEILVSIGDKSENFVGSKNWIGTLEEFYVLDVLFTLSCKILHVKVGENLVQNIRDYLEEYGGFIMMGGMVDTASKAIIGMHLSDGNVYLLIVDPHYTGVPKSAQDLIDYGYVRWADISEFENSLYNLCMPLYK